MRWSIGAFGALFWAVAVAAQDSTHAISEDSQSGWSPRWDLTIAVSSVAATALLFPFDDRIQRGMQSSTLQNASVLHNTAKATNAVGGAAPVVASLAMYGIGRLMSSEMLTHIGFNASASVLLASAATKAIKVVAGRQRPMIEAGDADDFSGGHGLQESHSSFPSGHSTAAFAFAASVTEDLRAERPEAARIVGPLLYGSAAMISVARMYANEHWASDVVLGAGIGILTGYQTAALSNARGSHRAFRYLSALSVSPGMVRNTTIVGMTLRLPNYQ